MCVSFCLNNSSYLSQECHDNQYDHVHDENYENYDENYDENDDDKEMSANGGKGKKQYLFPSLSY